MIDETIIFPIPDLIETLSGTCSRQTKPTLALVHDFKPQEYEILIEQDKILLQHGKDAEQHCRAGFEQFKLRYPENDFPCLRIRSSPKLERRGFMLDISRNRVPTRATLEYLVHKLWLLHYNELQLYTEHTFAYKNHSLVWEDASPLNAEDYQWLDKLCIRYGIDLVPNQNTFGHFERWLKYPKYHHLAESPRGFDHPFGFRMESGSVLRPGKESLEFIRELIGELLPNFSSPFVNIGCDETWELGKGKSAEEAKRRGVQTLYLEQLNQLFRLVKFHNKKPQFWADILLKDSASIEQMPNDVVPMIWGYESDHPFAEQCKTVQESGLDYYVVPGTSCWNSFTHRWQNTKTNLEKSSENAIQHGAKGILLTSWGDNGHLYPFSMMIPSVVACAGAGWSGKVESDEILVKIAHQLIFPENKSQEVESLFQLGTVERFFPEQLPNRSTHFLVATWPMKKLADFSIHLDVIKHSELLDWLEGIRRNIGSTENRLSSDLFLALELLKFSSARVQALQAGKDLSPDENLMNLFTENWLSTSRRGGLDLSLECLQGRGVR